METAWLCVYCETETLTECVNAIDRVLIKDNNLKWFRSYLTERSQSVSYNNTDSYIRDTNDSSVKVNNTMFLCVIIDGKL